MNSGPVNALNYGFLCELSELWKDLREDGNVRGVVLKSSFRNAFSAGLNLKEVFEMSATNDRNQITQFFRTLDSAFRGMLLLPKPIVSVVGGHSIAGGTILNLASDFVVLAPQNDKQNGGFMMGLTELQVGVPFPSLPFQIAERQLSPPAARLMTSGADLFSVFDSFNLGVGDKIVVQKGVHPSLSPAHKVVFAEGDTLPVAEEEADKWLDKILGRSLSAFGNWKGQWWRNVAPFSPPDSEFDELANLITTQECQDCMKGVLAKMK
eukprot:CAMPEP_0201490574 /NCGR_PEP_ID=MMETSP0151_2-20130828/26640_1 /ASSEMBLY_ACC=CAM_ASM_000257 /TAXON_ID=200890 /ORGANISM="Paramoeba atlantica, Strain 621/1 / CCAP 1560/9" /LENGTH=265 /DNA_ID=CAMNT_0047876575 /DNA_START=185 /DNA_END=982 /DNA_ORIENTATION=+